MKKTQDWNTNTLSAFGLAPFHRQSFAPLLLFSRIFGRCTRTNSTTGTTGLHEWYFGRRVPSVRHHMLELPRASLQSVSDYCALCPFGRKSLRCHAAPLLTPWSPVPSLYTVSDIRYDSQYLSERANSMVARWSSAEPTSREDPRNHHHYSLGEDTLEIEGIMVLTDSPRLPRRS